MGNGEVAEKKKESLRVWWGRTELEDVSKRRPVSPPINVYKHQALIRAASRSLQTLSEEASVAPSGDYMIADYIF